MTKITIADAQRYSANGEMAYQIEYSDDTKVRAVESRGDIIRREYLKAGKWVSVGKAYSADRVVWSRAAELIKATVIEFLA